MSLPTIGHGGKLIPDEDCLRGIIKHVPDYRAEAARLLWTRDPYIEDCIALIEHVALYADQAADRLLSLNPDPSHLDCIFEHVSNMDIRKHAAYYILHLENNCGRSRYAKIVLEVPDYSKEALDALLDCGPFSLYDFRVIWKFADESVRSEQWQRFVKNINGDYNIIRNVLMDRSLGVEDLAWPDFVSRVKERTFYFELLKYPHLCQRTWDYLTNNFEIKDCLINLITSYVPEMDEVWKELDDLEVVERHHILCRLLINEGSSNYIKNRAKIRYFAEDPMPIYWLRDILHIPACRNEAANRLLSGNFSPS